MFPCLQIPDLSVAAWRPHSEHVSVRRQRQRHVATHLAELPEELAGGRVAHVNAACAPIEKGHPRFVRGKGPRRTRGFFEGDLKKPLGGRDGKNRIDFLAVAKGLLNHVQAGPRREKAAPKWSSIRRLQASDYPTGLGVEHGVRMLALGGKTKGAILGNTLHASELLRWVLIV